MQKDRKPQAEASAPQKCVQVTDEAGHRYEATYLRRARGLVKHGRARFTDDSQTAIILTCPPKHEHDLEDIIMKEKINNINNTEETVNETGAVEHPVTEPDDSTDTSNLSDLSNLTDLSDLSENMLTENTLTARDVFDQIVTLQRQMMENSNALYRLTDAINDICSEDSCMSNDAREAAISEVTTVFMAREENYRQFMAFYQQMYNDLKPQNEAKNAERREFTEWVLKLTDATQCGQELPDFERLWKLFD